MMGGINGKKLDRWFQSSIFIWIRPKSDFDSIYFVLQMFFNIKN